MNRATVPLGPTENLLHEATLTSPGDIEDLPNKQKHTQGAIQNKKTKKLAPNEKNSITLRIQSNEIEAKYRIQNTGYKDAQ